MTPTLRTLLTFAAVTLNTAVVTVPDIPTWASGIIVALVTGAAAVGIVPPTLGREVTAANQPQARRVFTQTQGDRARRRHGEW